jgi:hypothetical protein
VVSEIIIRMMPLWRIVCDHPPACDDKEGRGGYRPIDKHNNNNQGDAAASTTPASGHAAANCGDATTGGPGGEGATRRSVFFSYSEGVYMTFTTQARRLPTPPSLHGAAY